MALGERTGPDMALEEVRMRLLKRPVPEAYRGLAEEVQFAEMPETFSRFTIREFTSTSIDLEALLDPIKQQDEARKLIQARKTPFGNELSRVIRGRTVFDLGCGIYPAVSFIAEACGAAEYIGVDESEAEGTRPSPMPGSKFRSSYFSEDMLSFLSQLAGLQGSVFHLSGLEPSELEGIPDDLYRDRDYVESQIYPWNVEYSEACMNEMKRVSSPGDAVVIGPATYGFHPERFGFTAERRSARKHYTIYERPQ